MPNGRNEIRIIDLGSITLDPDTAQTTKIIPLKEIKPNGKFSIIAEITGDGTAQIEYQTGYVIENMVIPEINFIIASGLTKTSGKGEDGKINIIFEPNLGSQLQLIYIEKSLTDSVTIDLQMAIQ